jgi:hypothetical protein
MIYHHTKFQDITLNGINVVAKRNICMAIMLESLEGIILYTWH